MPHKSLKTVLTPNYYSSLLETLYLLQSPANAAQLEQSIAQLNSGKAQVRKLIK